MFALFEFELIGDLVGPAFEPRVDDFDVYGGIAAGAVWAAPVRSCGGAAVGCGLDVGETRGVRDQRVGFRFGVGVGEVGILLEGLVAGGWGPGTRHWAGAEAEGEVRRGGGCWWR